MWVPVDVNQSMYRVPLLTLKTFARAWTEQVKTWPATTSPTSVCMNVPDT
ncbi:hypothetical protein ACFFHJ_16250 [Planotetraspora thailandica]|nr:hypothetical protein [Planotetraspora thailandica]